MNKDQFSELLAPQLKKVGFRKKGRTWHRENDEVIQVFNIQGSSWDMEDFYVNLGIYLRAIGSDPRPSENHCHVQQRVPREIDHDGEATLGYAMGWYSDRDSRDKLKSHIDTDSIKGPVLLALRKELLR